NSHFLRKESSMTNTLLPPQLISQLAWAYTGTSVLSASVALDVYSAMDSGNRTVETIAKRCGCSERGMRALLNTLVGFGLLSKDGTQFRLTPESQTFLVKGSPYFMGPLLEIIGDIEHGFAALPEVIRTGSPVARVDQESQGAEFFSRLIEGLFPLNYPTG